MVGYVVILGIVCVIIMILEGFFAGDAKHHIHVEHPVPGEPHSLPVHHPNDSMPCWKTDNVYIIEYCHQCESSVELKLTETCNKTGWIERVKCKSSDKITVYRTCPVPSSTPFWRFELCMIVLSFLSGYFSYRRETSLEAKAFERIKQVSCGV